MFSSFSSFSSPLAFLARSSHKAIDLKSVDLHEVETQHDKKARTLKHLLKLNHASHSILFHDLQFHNHMPHLLGSAYILGSEPEHLNEIYDHESEELEKWKDSPGEISTYDWRDYLGRHEYQRAFVDFFEDELVLNGYDWQRVLSKYLFEGKEPLANCLVSGLGHPLIHLGYAFELSSREVAMEALGLTATCYSFLHKYIDDPSYTRDSQHSNLSPLELLRCIREDKRFDEVYHHLGNDLEPLFDAQEEAVLEYWNAWQLTAPRKQFEQSQQAAAALLVTTHKPGTKYDFFLVHLLTTSHAVRIVLPLIPPKFHLSLVRQWWLLTIAYYIAQLRPEINLDVVRRTDLKSRDWAWVDKQAISGQHALDAHYVKGLRAMKEAAKTWGDDDSFYLKAAVQFGEGFDGWGGFE